ncbi:MAG: NAD-dependent epimerase/dehydratase family protein [Planctomycetes bacterium]|nr:NAD-dependent epimerase/dehydratase family protein [Planctomycetota bacterium]
MLRPLREKRLFRVGVVGAGYISEFHMRALRRLPGVQVVGIADRDPSRAGAVAERFQSSAFPSLAALAESGAEVIHVLTPPDSHAPLALEALERGCHVLVEKPLATSPEDCDRLAATAQATGLTVGVVHSYLRDPFMVRALEAVRRGDIGEVVTVDYLRSSAYPPYRGGPLPPPYREGGYPFRDMGVHALYLMEAFLGEIEDVDAQFRTQGGDPNLLFDEWQALVRCRRGTGHVQLSWSVKPPQHVLIAQGTRGVLRADLFSMFVSVRRKRRLPSAVERVTGALAEGGQICRQVPWNVARHLSGGIRRYHGLQALVEEFYESLAAERPAPFTPAAARPIVDWVERVARRADEAKEQLRARLAPSQPSASILITGATGFIGRRLLARLLERGERVRILVRRPPPDELAGHPLVEIAWGDLGDPDAVEHAMKGARQVYHLGAAVHGDDADFERGAVAGTQNVVQSGIKHAIDQLVYVSSLSVLHLAAVRRGCAVREDWPLEPHPQRRGGYTQSKLAAERIVAAAVHDQGLPAVILRPGQVFGPGGDPVTGAVAQRLGNRLILLGSGRTPLPLVHVEDVVDAILAAGQSDIRDGSVFHLVDPVRMTQQEVLDGYRRSAPNFRYSRLPLPLVYSLALAVQGLVALTGKPAPLSTYRVRSSRAPLTVDCSAARQRLGWAPRVGVEAGLEALWSTPPAHPAPT